MNINLSFKKEFAPLVESGKKRQTIRQRRTNYAQPGDILHLFTGMRTKKCRKLADVKCISAEWIFIDTARMWVLSSIEPLVKYSFDEVEKIAKADGFKNQNDFFAFFRQQYGEDIHEMRLYRW